MDKELLTVAEYAEKMNISQQAVYQRIKRKNSTLLNFVVKQDGKTFIRSEVLNVGKNSVETEQAQAEPERKQSVDEIALAALTKQLEELQSQLKVKDEQIAGLQKLVDQQQQLQLADKQEILMLREQLALNAAPAEPEEITVQQPEPQKKGFFAKLFGW